MSLRAITVARGNMKRLVRVDVTDQQLKGLAVGAEVTMTVKGTVKVARAEEKPSKKEKKEGFEGWPGSVELEISSLDFDTNEFSQLSEE